MAVRTGERKHHYVDRIPEWRYYQLDWKAYCSRLKLTPKLICKTLHITDSQYSKFRLSGSIPMPVWQRAVAWWGDQGITPGNVKRANTKSFLLDKFYADPEATSSTKVAPPQRPAKLYPEGDSPRLRQEEAKVTAADATPREKGRYRETRFYPVNVVRYVQLTGVTTKEFREALQLMPGQYWGCTGNGVLPVPVWHRAVALWGDLGMQVGKMQHRPGMQLDISYRNTPVPPAAAAPAVASAPEAAVPVSASAGRDAEKLLEGVVGGYEASIRVIAHYAATLMAEKALLEREVHRLHREIERLSRDQETEADLHALDKTIGTTKASEPAVKIVRDTLHKVVPNAGLLREVEARLPFLTAR